MNRDELLDLIDDMMNWRSYFKLKALDNDVEASEYVEVLDYWIEKLHG